MAAHEDNCGCDDCRPLLRPEEAVAVHLWRRKCFRELGFTRGEAEDLDLADVDLHRMIDLRAHGCSKELARRIVAPL